MLPALLAGAALTACNEKAEETEPDATDVVNSVAVNSFSLKPDADVLSDLDSVFFSIDLRHGAIFNADSLPKGTDVRALQANITYSSTVTAAEIIMEGGTHRTGTFDYKANPTDTIDFTGKVTLRLTAGDGLSRDYKLKVNVHRSQPDSLIWDKVAVSQLPSRLSSPVAQKSVELDDNVLSLIRESDGSYTLASCTDLVSASWSKKAVTPGFTPSLQTLTSSGGRLYVLDDTGRLMQSADGETWIATGETWSNVIGDYNNVLLGLRRNGDGSYTHVSYPRDAVPELSADEAFPVKGYSNAGVFYTDWADGPTAFIVGGTDASGRASGATWAYDGTRWTDISNRALPALQGAVVFPYYAFRSQGSSAWMQEGHTIWIAMGGITTAGQLNRTLFLSYDNGVNWEKAPQLMQLPLFIPALSQSDVLIGLKAMSSDLAKRWKALPSPRPRGALISYETDGTTMRWKCPYIYLIGGYDTAGVLNAGIYRGVLARLSYPAVF